MLTQRKGRALRHVGAAAGLILLTLAGGAGARPPQTGQKPLQTGQKPLVAKRGKTVALSGNVGGTWTQTPAPPDAGGSYQISGNGDVAPLGPVRAAGSLHSPGMIANGRTTGTLTLTGAHGTLTLALSGSPQAGGSAPSSSLTFTVVSATGDYQAKGTGTAHLVMTPQRRPAAVPGRMTPHFIVAAMFRLTFGGAGAS